MSDEIEPLSWRGYCSDCFTSRIYEANMQISEHRGPIFDHWRRRCVAAFGGVLPEDTR